MSYAFDKLPDDEKITGDNNGILNVLHDYLLRGRIAMKRAELADNKLDEKKFLKELEQVFKCR